MALRTRFAAPFVIVIAGASAGGCGDSTSGATHPARAPSWQVQRTPTGCEAMPRVDCPPPEVATCNPPPPLAIACPADAPAGAFQVIEQPPGHCTIDGTQIALPCPRYDQPPPPIDAAVAAAPSRRWDVLRRDRECLAQDDPCARRVRAPDEPIPPCNPPAPIKIACPPVSVVAISEQAPGTCVTVVADCDPGVKCNPPPPEPIACPTP
ncbi:MAG: hypothetical protein IPL61_26920 [Myxococcales bacterium]|nr:hypothetical protein [Myxococcales bacterium]